jgi:acyl-CoA synthetase (AMP-forming)/AMP-acid ligase II
MMYVQTVERAVRYYPDWPALCLGGASSEDRLTFRELHSRVRALASALHRHGLQPGDRLALLLPNGPEYIQLIYACSWLGVIAVPINTRLSRVEIEHVLYDAQPKGIIRHSILPAPIHEVPWEHIIDTQTWDGREGSCPDPCYQPESALALIYTSGTTGRPKGVTVTHSNILANIHSANYWIRYRDGGVYLHAAPMFHIADFPTMFAAPAFGVCQTSLARFDPLAFCQAVEKEQVNYTVLVPTMINSLSQLVDRDRHDLRSLEVLAYGGSPIAPELVQRIRSWLPKVHLVQVYGLSETGFLTGLKDQDHADHPLSCGKPCPGIDVRVVGETGIELEIGQRGELVARGANVMNGYWNNPSDSTSAFRGGFFRTGDVGYRDSEGFLYILDRLKDMIVTGGENVYCGEVEAVLFTHPSIREAAVFGVPDPKWGELVVACVVLKKGTSLQQEVLIEFCRQSLANYKIPRHVVFLDSELPKNGTGKVLKRLLRDRFPRLHN